MFMCMIFYDIADARRLYKTARILEDCGVRVQKSVFYCNVSESELKKIIFRLRSIVNWDEDSIIIQNICASCCRKADFIGKNKVEKIDELSDTFQIF